MRLFNIEAGPWGGFILILLVLGFFAAIYFTSWLMSGIVLGAVIGVILVAVYFGGKRVNRRLVHGRRR